MTNQEAIRLLSMGRLAYNEVEAEAFCEAYDMAIEALKADWCDDAISRQAVKELYYKDGYIDFRKICELPSVTPCPCEDCISRQAAIDDIWDGTNMDIYTREVKEHLEALPPVTPARKMGRWIMHIDDLFPSESTMECSECGEHQPITIDDNYCPNCGAKMEVGA